MKYNNRKILHDPLTPLRERAGQVMFWRDGCDKDFFMPIPEPSTKSVTLIWLRRHADGTFGYRGEASRLTPRNHSRLPWQMAVTLDDEAAEAQARAAVRDHGFAAPEPGPLSPEEIERRKADFQSHPLIRRFYGPQEECEEPPAEADPETSPEILARLLFHEYEHVREIAGLNPSTPSDALAASVMMGGLDDGHTAPLKSIAENPSCPPDVLASLAGLKDCEIRQALARNESCPPDVLATLTDFNDIDLAELARNRSCPPDVLATLARHEQSGVRIAVALNESCHRDILATLACERGDEFWKPDKEIMELFGLRGDEDHGWDVRKAAASNSACPPDILEMLAGDEHWEVREMVAWNKNTSTETLEKLMGDIEGGVRKGVAANGKASPSALEKLAGDEDFWVRRHAQAAIQQAERENAEPPRDPKPTCFDELARKEPRPSLSERGREPER